MSFKKVEAILAPILKDKVKQELPLRLTKKEDVWIIDGKLRTPRCKDDDKKCFHLDQSPVHLELSSKDGRVIKLYQLK